MVYGLEKMVRVDPQNDRKTHFVERNTAATTKTNSSKVLCDPGVVGSDRNGAYHLFRLFGLLTWNTTYLSQRLWVGKYFGVVRAKMRATRWRYIANEIYFFFKFKIKHSATYILKFSILYTYFINCNSVTNIFFKIIQ